MSFQNEIDATGEQRSREGANATAAESKREEAIGQCRQHAITAGSAASCSSLGMSAQRRKMRRQKVVRCPAVSSRASAARFGPAIS